MVASHGQFACLRVEEHIIVCAASSLMVLIYYYSQSVEGLWEKGGRER